MITPAQATQFAHEWIDAWNAHDLERILSHWAEDVVFTSPLARRLLGDATGTVRGKDALRAYFGKGLLASPDLRFELDTVFVGQGSIVVGYRNHRGQSCAEWMRLGPDGRAVEGAAHYTSLTR
jgi:ketosteroid isomerase-like protein